MNINSEGYVYISTGSEQKMYTLRQWWQEVHYSQGVPTIVNRTQYMCNLSTNKEEAIRKAKEWANRHSVPFSNRAPDFELNEITRATPEQIAERNARDAEEEKARQQRLAEYEATVLAVKKKEYEEQQDLLAAGKVPFGKYRDCTISKLSPDLVLYYMGIPPREGEYEIGAAFVEALYKAHPHLVAMPTPKKDAYVGEVKERINFTATLIKVFSFEGFYGTTHCNQFVTKEGVLLHYMGGTCPYSRDDLGKDVEFAATVKKHDEYKGQAQTIIQRIKVKKKGD